jgi:hypothetical protein
MKDPYIVSKTKSPDQGPGSSERAGNPVQGLLSTQSARLKRYIELAMRFSSR